MPVDVVVVGSLNQDVTVRVPHIPAPGETVLGGDATIGGGGKGANQAVAAARLGRRVSMIGRVGDDEGGEILRAALDADQVDTRHLTPTPDTPNGVALISVGSDGDNAIVVSPGANARLTRDDVEAAADVLAGADVTLLQLEIPLAAVHAAAALSGGIVVLNPAPAPSEPLPTTLLEAIDVLVPNQSELATLAGHDGPVDATSAAVLAAALPCRSVVVTLGAQGALVVADGEVEHIAAPTVAPVDTTAAGGNASLLATADD